MASTIISQITDSFDKANESGDLLFFPSTIHHHEESGVQFEIRLCPALQNKPKLPTPHFDHSNVDSGLGVDQRKPDPFAPPYIPNLFVGELHDKDREDDYVILLNKYSVVPCHFLLVTKEFKSQASPLLPSDLVQAYLLIDAARKIGRNFFAFYNCGDLSGASQAHKHMQFIPVEDGGPPVEQLAKAVHLDADHKAFTLNSLPYANHVRRLPPHASSLKREDLEDCLGQAYVALLDLVISTVRHAPNHPVGAPSYNVILTLGHLYLVPRSKEEHVLRETGEKLSVNALGFAGMLLVKSERELEAVKKEGVGKILRDVALESVHDEQICDPHEIDLDS